MDGSQKWINAVTVTSITCLIMYIQNAFRGYTITIKQKNKAQDTLWINLWLTWNYWPNISCFRGAIGLLPDTCKCGLRMRREWRECFPRHRHQRKPPVSGPGVLQGTCVTHVPWCMLGSLTRGGGENVPGIPVARATRNCTYSIKSPWHLLSHS